MDRRGFLRLAGGATAGLVFPACSSGAESRVKPAATAKTKRPTLRILQWSHFVPAYDAWFDHAFAKPWGDDHDIEVVVDHIANQELLARADTEVAAQRGHDIVGFITPPPRFEDDVIDHREIVTEVEAKLDKLIPLVERSILNAKTGRYFAFSDSWAPDPVNFRVDLWDRVEAGLVPGTWADVLSAGQELKAMGHPLGLSMSPEIDGNLGLLALMHAHGASIVDEAGDLALNRPATVEAVKMGTELFRAGMTDEAFLWDPASNNRYLASARGSLILNAISALRAIEGQDPALAATIRLAPTPAGPAARLAPAHVIGAYIVWRFSPNQEIAKQFLVDLALAGREAFLQSGFYNMPSFEDPTLDLNALVQADPALPAGKYSVLADATSWSTNLGYPGTFNAAVEQVLDDFIIPRMFAAAARGELSPGDAVAAAVAQSRPTFDKWRERGKI